MYEAWPVLRSISQYALLALGIALGPVDPEESRGSGMASTEPAPASATMESARPHVAAVYGKLPLSFETNCGQTDQQVRFFSRGTGYALFLTATEAVLRLNQPTAANVTRPNNARSATSQPTVLRMNLLGANIASQIEGLDRLPGKSHYFIGNDPTMWCTNVPTFARVRYRNVYPGIDVVYYGKHGELEHDFVVAPGADPGTIRLRFAGADKVDVDREGNLVLLVPGGRMELRKPVAYQDVNGSKKAIRANFRLRGTQHVTFEVAAHDLNRPLIIDPVFTYSVLLGGTGQFEEGSGIAVDSSGAAYVTGYTQSATFPTVNPLQNTFGGNADAFVIKLNAAGTALVYSTYLGGSGSDNGRGITVDPLGSAYVTGNTNSTDFPTPPGAFPNSGQSAFVAKLNSSGNALVYSVFLGGSRGSTASAAVSVDSAGSAYVTGRTDAPDFPTTRGAFQSTFGGSGSDAGLVGDAFVTKVSAAGNVLIYSTFLGGGGADGGNAVAVDGVGNAFVTGSTRSSNFPVTPGAFQPVYASPPSNPQGDAFVTKFNGGGTGIIYSTYLGGNGDDSGNAIAVDVAGNAFVAGYTWSTNFPVVNAFQRSLSSVVASDAFVTNLNPAGTGLVYSTYFGGQQGTSGGAGTIGTAIAVNASGAVYITGQTGARDFPTTADAQQARFTVSNNGAQVSAFVTKFNASGTGPSYSTYLSGSGAASGKAVAVDSLDSVYVTGFTDSTDFPAVRIDSSVLGGTRHFFVAKIAQQGAGPPTVGAGGVVDGARFTPQLAPGGIISIFGSGFATTAQAAESLPLRSWLGLTKVAIEGLDAPLFYVSPTQINAQLPFELEGKIRAAIKVVFGGAPSDSVSLTLSPVAPGIFTLTSDGRGAGAILHTNDLTLVSSAKPATRNEGIAVYATGLGSVSPAVPSGAPGPRTPLSRTTQEVSATIGGMVAQVVFSGLAPDFVGVYQVNVIVPSNAPIGDAVPIAITIGGVTSNNVTIAVR